MKINLLLSAPLILLILLSSCKKEETLPSINQFNIDSKYSNPSDQVGQVHNAAIHYMIQDLFVFNPNFSNPMDSAQVDSVCRQSLIEYFTTVASPSYPTAVIESIINGYTHQEPAGFSNLKFRPGAEVMSSDYWSYMDTVYQYALTGNVTLLGNKITKYINVTHGNLSPSEWTAFKNNVSLLYNSVYLNNVDIPAEYSSQSDIPLPAGKEVWEADLEAFTWTFIETLNIPAALASAAIASALAFIFSIF